MNKVKILIVDDEVFNLEILDTDLTEAGYDVVRAIHGKDALEKLATIPEIELIVLDRMMPVMDGITLLNILKSDEKTRYIPVIMQTAAAQSKQVLEGLKAGAYYYLIKPYNEKLLLSIVQAALSERHNFQVMQEALKRHASIAGLLKEATFCFRTLQEASSVAYYIANCCPESEKVVYGLNELMINAIEHGNLGITYEDKTELVLDGKWQEEVVRRLKHPDYAHKKATLYFSVRPHETVITIEDEGTGFNWRSYLEFTPSRLVDPHGRGIAMARTLSFSSVEYNEEGNRVTCRVKPAI